MVSRWGEESGGDSGCRGVGAATGTTEGDTTSKFGLDTALKNVAWTLDEAEMIIQHPRLVSELTGMPALGWLISWGFVYATKTLGLENGYPKS